MMKPFRLLSFLVLFFILITFINQCGGGDSPSGELPPNSLILYARDQIELAPQAKVGTGLVISEGDLTLGQETQVLGEVQALGNVYLNNFAHIQGSLSHSGTLQNDGALVQGGIFQESLDLPNFLLPLFQSSVCFSDGEVDLFEASQDTCRPGLRLAAGEERSALESRAYDFIYLESGARLVLSGGDYYVGEVYLTEGAEILYESATRLYIVNGFTSERSIVLDVANSTLSDENLEIISDIAELRLGENSFAQARFYLEAGRLVLGQDSTVIGSLMAREVFLEQGATLSLGEECAIDRICIFPPNPGIIISPPPEPECVAEICDGQDNDCDEAIDEDLEFCENGQSTLPPDPAQVAPAITPTTSTTTHAATQFLYTGINPIQTGVTPGTIDEKAAAVVRGRVLNLASEPLPGVTVRIKGRPEYGQTLTRIDGWFDMVVNSGDVLTVLYEREGYLSSQRRVPLPWQDYVVMEEVVLLELDPQVSVVDLAAPEIQVAQGSPQTDADGTRQARVLIEPGTVAQAVLPDGSTQDLNNLTIRITEATVGENGPKAMPAKLPPASAYTYAVNLRVEEAEALGADHVTFSQPVPFYVDNFLNFAVGLKVPLGVLDPNRLNEEPCSADDWVGEPDGRIIQVLSETGGMADLDLTGDGFINGPADLAELNIDDAERAKLAELYEPGESFWRVELNHFSWVDLNYPRNSPPPDLPLDPPSPLPPPAPPSCTSTGSIIECQSQVLGETIPVVGTPFSLNYQSDRVPGRVELFFKEIPVMGEIVPANLLRINAEISVAGRVFYYDIEDPQPYETIPLNWDGFSIYNQALRGQQRLKVKLNYVYVQTYGVPAASAVSFGLECEGPPVSYPSGFVSCVIPAEINSNARQEYTHTLEWEASITPPAMINSDFGAWSLDIHHRYDPKKSLLQRGDGVNRQVYPVNAMVEVVAGTGVGGFSGDGGLATEAQIGRIQAMAFDSDGDLFLADIHNNRVRRIDMQTGIITTVAGNGLFGNGPDGLLATNTVIEYPDGVVLDSQGNLYIASNHNNKVRRVDAVTGIANTVAGNESLGASGDGGPATMAAVGRPTAIEMDSEENLYIAQYDDGYVRRVDAVTGIITTVAGNGLAGHSGDGGLAINAAIGNPRDIAFDSQENLYIVDQGNHRIRRVDALTGIITTVSGMGLTAGVLGDGSFANQSPMDPRGISFDEEDNYYIAENSFGDRLRKVDNECIINTVAGGATGDIGVEGPAGQMNFGSVYSVEVGPEGYVYFMDNTVKQVFRLRAVFAGEAPVEYLIPSEDGSEFYLFDLSGRHLQTLDALSNVVKYQFNYNGAGYLVSVTDRNGQTTNIQRNVDNEAQAIVAPFGQVTNLTMDLNGYMNSLTNPAGESYSFVYEEDGLLTQMTNPRNFDYLFEYDDAGRLTKDTDPLGGFTELARTVFEDEGAYEVLKTTAMGRTTTYRVEEDPASELNLNWVNIFSDGTQASTNYTPSSQIINLPDGTQIINNKRVDSRVGLGAPLPERVITLPSGLSKSESISENTDLVNPDNLLSLSNKTISSCVNGSDESCTGGRLSVSTYDSVARQMTIVSAEGRQVTANYDEQGRITRTQVASLVPTQFSYNEQGQMISLTVGEGAQARVQTFTYGSDGFLNTLTNPLAEISSFTHDLVGRVAQVNLPDGQVLGTTYNAGSHVASLTPPGQSAHHFSYNALGLEELYTPPPAGIDTGILAKTYNQDRQISALIRADGLLSSYTYDFAGRLESLGLARGNIVYNYDPITGKLRLINAPGVDLNFNYDGSLLTDIIWSGGISGSVNFIYNDYFEIETQSINGLDPFLYTYDDDGLLVQVDAINLIRDPSHGLILDTTLLNITSSQTYNVFGELETFSSAFDNGMVTDLYQELIVSRDALGRITERQETIGGVTTNYTYEYNVRGWLENIYQNGIHVAYYQYDANGNRILYENPSTLEQVNSAYDAQDRLQSHADYTYTYTANGELSYRQNNNTGNIIQTTYDELGNLINMTLEDGTLIEYIIDGQNRRVGKRINGILSQGFLYQDQLNPAVELDDTGAILSRFVYAAKANVPDFMIRGGETYRILSDHLGSVRLVVNATTGVVEQRIDYDDFGQVILDTNQGFQPFGFAGGIYDYQTGLVRFGARDYDAQVGRWTAKDPVLFQGNQANIYVYVGNDPVNKTDQTGLWTFPWSDVPGMPFDLPGISREAHQFRNILNRCPQTVQACQSDSRFEFDDRPLIGGKFRGSDGSECKYDELGDLLPDPNGTYNFMVEDGSSEKLLGHVYGDFLAHFWYGGDDGYEPSLTNTFFQ